MVMMRGAYCDRPSRGTVDRLDHLAQDVRAAFLGLHAAPRAGSRPERPLALVSSCSAVMPVARAGDLEVHVAEEVLDALDVGQDRGLVVARP